MNLYELSVPQFLKLLRQLQRLLDKAVEYGASRSFDPNVLLSARLYPDQYPLVRQIQTASDTAKLTTARLTNKQAPVHPDNEQTIDELRARLASCLQFLESVTPADFEGADTRPISLSFMPGKCSVGIDYLTEFGLPNFYFHATTAYAILRHNGVPLGKADFIGGLRLRDA